MIRATYSQLKELPLTWMIGASLCLLTLSACEPEVTYSTQEVVVDINSCIRDLNFEQPDGCASYYGATAEGCFVLSDDRGSTQAFPILIDETGLSALNGDADLIGALSLSADRGAKMSIFLFSSNNESDPDRCQSLRVDSVCEGECVIAVSEHPIEVARQANLLKIEANECQWTPADRALTELLCDQLDNDCDGRVDENEAEPNAPREGEDCSVGLGVCSAQGRFECLDGVGQAPRCSAMILEVEEVERCDDLDNDCDGTVDEGFGVGEPCVELEGTACQVSGELRCESVNEDEPLMSGEVYCDIGDVIQCH